MDRNLPANQGTWVGSLVWEATKPLCHSYWDCTLEPKGCNKWSPRAPREATAMRSLHTPMESSPHSLQLEKAHVQLVCTCTNATKNNKWINCEKIVIVYIIRKNFYIIFFFFQSVFSVPCWKNAPLILCLANSSLSLRAQLTFQFLRTPSSWIRIRSLCHVQSYPTVLCFQSTYQSLRWNVYVEHVHMWT